MSKTYTKLDDSITDSTIWMESSDTRVVWITLLAMADWDGYVGASVPGIANRARVSLEAAETAMAKFQAPDPHSRSKVKEGRRVEVAPRGFLIINFAEHRDRQLADARREYFRQKKREQRANVQDKNVDMLDNERMSTHSDSDRDSDGYRDRDRNGSETDSLELALQPPASAPRKPASKYSEPFEALWEHTGRCHGNKGAAWTAFKKFSSGHARGPAAFAEQELRPAWDAYMASSGPAGGFIQHLSTWLNQRGWETDWQPARAATRDDRNTDVVQAWLKSKGVAHG